MTRSTATPQPSIIMPVCPVGTNATESPAARPAFRSSSATDILPIAQSVPTVRITRLPGRWRRPTAVSKRSGGRRKSMMWTPAIAAAADSSGSSPRKVWSPEWSSSPASIAAWRIGRHSSGSRPPVGAIPMSSVSGRGRPGIARASARVPTIGTSDPGIHSAVVRPASVESSTAITSSRP